MKEFSSLSKLRSILPRLPRGWTGPGDDCAVIPWKRNKNLVVTCDSLLEGVHFYSRISKKDLMYKALQVNLSDLAAMGAKPLGVFFSVALPKNRALELPQILRLFAKECVSSGVPLLGGDTTSSKSGLVLSVTALGEIKNTNLKLRSMARPKQLVAVVGKLGASFAGFKLLKRAGIRSSEEKRLIKVHLRPKALLREGQFLSAQKSVCAMMDLSDGLASDLGRIAEMSKVGFEIFSEALPIATTLNDAIIGGEDYGLLLTVEAQAWPKIHEAFSKQFKVPLTAIGQVTENRKIVFMQKGRPLKKTIAGFDHFQK